MVPEAGFEPARAQGPSVFETDAYAIPPLWHVDSGLYHASMQTLNTLTEALIIYHIGGDTAIAGIKPLNFSTFSTSALSGLQNRSRSLVKRA